MDQEILSDIVPQLRNICSVFHLNSFPANSPMTHLPNQQPFCSEFYICLCQNDAHFKYYTSINISERSCLLYLHICLADVPDSSRQFHILPSDAVDTSTSLRIRVIADSRINNSICFMNAGEGVVLLWRLIQLKPSELGNACVFCSTCVGNVHLTLIAN